MPDTPALPNATAAYVAPFAAFLGIMAAEHYLFPGTQAVYPFRFFVVSAMVMIISRPYLPRRPRFPAASIGIGIAVFLIWIGPDALFGYRHFWLFENSLTGHVVSTVPPDLRLDIPFRVLRVLGTMALVPIVEELFWRGWMMRWLIRQDFMSVPLGTYLPSAFWMVAILFASEHGPYWEVGLAAGVIYNWWLIRTKNLADCILAHAVTNGILAAYVLLTGRWQYWL